MISKKPSRKLFAPEIEENKQNGNKGDRFIRSLEPGIIKIVERTYMNSEIDKYANRFISQFLIHLFEVTVKNLKEINANNVIVEDLQRTISQVLPPSLVKYAISEGQKEVFLSQSMALDFIPKLKKSKAEKDKRLQELMKRKDRDILTRNIIRGVGEVVSDTLPGAKFDSSGTKNICFFLVDLSDLLVKRLKINNPEDASLDDIQKVVQDLLPTLLAEHAKSEGHRMLFDFQNKVYEFVPEVPISTVSEEAAATALGMQLNGKKKLVEGKEFQSGLSPILNEIHHNSAIDSKSQKLVCSNLNKLKQIVVDEMKLQQGAKTPIQVREIIQLHLPHLMAEHAVAEGEKLLQRFDSGEFDFVTKKYKAITQSRSRVKSASVSALQILESGIIAIAKSILPKANLHKSGVVFICNELNTLCDVLIGSVKDLDTRKITSQDVQRATKDLIPATLAEHAIAEGEKMVSLFDMKGITFVPHSVKKKKSGNKEN